MSDYSWFDENEEEWRSYQPRYVKRWVWEQRSSGEWVKVEILVQEGAGPPFPEEDDD